MTKNALGSAYAWAIAVACVAFYPVPLEFGANHNGLFIVPVGRRSWAKRVPAEER